MADHEVQAAQMHQQFPDPDAKTQDIAGGTLLAGPEYRPSTVLARREVIEREPSIAGDSQKNSVLTQTPDGEVPNEHEKATLRHVGENLPISAWLVATVELCERFTYYGCQGLFQNYVQRPLNGSEGRGGLGLGQQGATGLTTFFQFWCYVTPVLGAIVADQYLGRYKTIVTFCIIYIVGLVVLFVTSLPVALDSGAGLGGFVTAILIIGLGTGGIKSNVAPLIADQYTRKKMAIQTTPKGERIILDPAVTYQRIYMIFYTCINIGSLSLLATPYMELYIGFWSAFLLALGMFSVGLGVLLLGRKYYVVRPPTGSIITNAFKAMWVMAVNRSMDAAKPSWQAINGKGTNFPWSDHFIEELKTALSAMKVFLAFPIFWVAYGQCSGNLVSQAAEMSGHGLPNDEMQNADPLSIILIIPILDRLIYPMLQKAHIQFRPITRITIGFFVASLAMAYAAIVQNLIYSAGPCYGSPLCKASIVDGMAQGNDVHIAIQTPAYLFIGLAEIFLSVTGLEYAYTKAPPSMKSFVQAMYLLTNAFGSALGEALSPLAYDPAILWMFAGLAVVCAVTSVTFWFLFRHLNAKEDEMNALNNAEEEEEEASSTSTEKNAEKV